MDWRRRKDGSCLVRGCKVSNFELSSILFFLIFFFFSKIRIKQPSVIFIDEIDSLLTARSDNENEATRRIKTEFLVQLDGVANGAEERLLLVGATNRPQELDEAARRRMTKRL